MHIDKILINNFKNYKTYKASFIDGINYLFGENGVGKTNLLDAIYYLSLGKSAINTKDDENIRMQGQSTDMEITLKQMQELRKDLYNILSEHTGKSYSQIEKDSDRDKWMRSEEAKEYGIIDEVLTRKS